MKQHHVVAYAYDKRGRLISVGCNSYQHSSSLQRHCAKRVGEPYRVFNHAEVDALVRAKGQAVHKLRIERHNRIGQPVCAKPCRICWEAIRLANVKIVEYT